MGEGEGLIVCTESLPMKCLCLVYTSAWSHVIGQFPQPYEMAFYRNIEPVVNDLLIAMQLSFHFICYQCAERDLFSEAVLDGLKFSQSPTLKIAFGGRPYCLP